MPGRVAYSDCAIVRRDKFRIPGADGVRHTSADSTELQSFAMRSPQSIKIDEMRSLARQLREYASRRSFSVYAENMSLVAEELDQCATTVEAQGTVLQ